MYVTFRYWTDSKSLVDALVAKRDEVERLIGGIAGFRAYYLVPTGEGAAVSVNVFDDQAGADESNRVAAEWVRENLSDVSINPPQISAGEAVITF